MFVRSFDREALPHRVAVVAATCAEAAVALRAVTADDVALAKSSATCALLFPGQGSQRAAMGRGLRFAGSTERRLLLLSGSDT